MRKVIFSSKLMVLGIGILVNFSAFARQSTCADVFKSEDSIAVAGNFVSTFTAHFERLFNETSGVGSYELFRAKLAASDLETSEAFRLIDADNLELAYFAQVSSRDSISQRGILNQHSTQTSRGAMNNYLRNEAEAHLSGANLQAYALLNPSIKPKSVIVRPRSGASVYRQTCTLYGGDTYILRKKDLISRLTWTPGDSLNRYVSGNRFSREKQSGGQIALAWDQMFIPWKDRDLMLPYVQASMSSSRKFAYGGKPSVWGKNHLPDLAGEQGNQQIRVPVPHLNFSEGWDQSSQEYVEGQIWGPIDLSNVESFYFTTDPPAGDFLKALRLNHVKIFDASVLIRPDERGKLSNFSNAEPTPWESDDQ